MQLNTTGNRFSCILFLSQAGFKLKAHLERTARANKEKFLGRELSSYCVGGDNHYHMSILFYFHLLYYCSICACVSLVGRQQQSSPKDSALTKNLKSQPNITHTPTTDSQQETRGMFPFWTNYFVHSLRCPRF